MPSGLDDHRFWELRADAARMLAEEMNDDDQGRAAMLRISEEYRGLAARCILKLNIPCSQAEPDTAIVGLPNDKDAVAPRD